MVQDIDDVILGNYYTIYYSTGDMATLQTMYGIADVKDKNYVLFKSLDQSSFNVHKIRYNQSDKRSKELSISSNSSTYTKDIDVYDCVPWESKFDIQCFAYHWSQSSGRLKMCMPGFDINPISKPIGYEDEFELVFKDGTSIEFSGVYKDSDRVGSLIFEGKNVLEGHEVEINDNIRISELNFCEKPWFTEQVPFSEDVNGFCIQIDEVKEYDTINRTQNEGI